MRPATTDDRRQQHVIARIEQALAGDARIRAAWLEGSYAEDNGGPWSDLDLHLALRDEDADDFYRNALPWIRQHIDEPHGYLPAAFGPVRMVGVTLDSWVRLDLFVEPASRIAGIPRPALPRILLDRDGLAGRFDVRRPAAMEAPEQVRRLLDGLFFGFTWPARLTGREEWGSLLLNAVLVVYQFIVPAMLVQHRPEHAYRPHLHNERFLPPDRRREVDALLASLAAAFAPLASGAPDLEAVADAHRRLVSTLLRELRAACTATGVEWPAAAERSLRAFYLEELGIPLD